MPSEVIMSGRRAERDRLIERAGSVLQGDSRVVAAWLGGSLGRGDYDDWSDIDLYIVVNDGDIPAGREDRAQFVTETLGEPVLLLEAPQNAPQGGAYALSLQPGRYGPQQVDWYWLPASAAVLPTGTRLLFDKVDLPPEVSETTMTDEERRETTAKEIAFFWVMSGICAKKIARHDTWAALRMLDMLHSTLEGLKWLAGRREDRPTYADQPSYEPPTSESLQLARLRELCSGMLELGPAFASLGVQPQVDTGTAVMSLVSAIWG